MQPFAWVCRWRCVGVSGLSSGGRAEQDAAWQQLWAADELMAQSEGLTDPDTAHVTLRGEVSPTKRACRHSEPHPQYPFALWVRATRPPRSCTHHVLDLHVCTLVGVDG
eukprot:m.15832 g.15832  ORF g.15832 m.15832 type:complete len:109 (-) comp10818_c0_seq1:1613-1939(-)